jgi:hypothetical protein
MTEISYIYLRAGKEILQKKILVRKIEYYNYMHITFNNQSLQISKCDLLVFTDVILNLTTCTC